MTPQLFHGPPIRKKMIAPLCISRVQTMRWLIRKKKKKKKKKTLNVATLANACLISSNEPGGGGGTDLEREYGDVRPWRPPFHASPAAHKGPISSKRVSSQDPLLRKFGNFSLNSLDFHPNFSSQAPKFGNFQLTSPQIWKFSAHKPSNLEIFRSQAPLFRGKCQFASPTSHSGA